MASRRFLFASLSRFTRLDNINLGVRHYSRLMRKKPIRVYSATEAQNLHKHKQKHQYSADKPIIAHSPAGEATSTSETKDSFYIPPHIRYETLHEGDKRFGPVVLLSKSRKSREKRRLILLEGRRLIRDAVSAGAGVRSLFFTRGEVLEDFPLDDMITDGVALYKVKARHMDIWSDLVTPPGIMAVCEMPRVGEALLRVDQPLPLTVICDNIRDPGNLGSLLRSAAAVGCQRVLLTKGCIDVWEPKVLRSGSGAHFRTSIINNLGWELLSNYLAENSRVYQANHSSTSTDPTNLTRAEKHRIYNQRNTDTQEFIEEGGQRLVLDESYNDEKLLETFSKVSLPMSSCYSADFTDRPVTLVVGGETEGISAQARKLTFDRFGERLYIPMAEGVDSLNSAVAASVIMYEMKRQMLALDEKKSV